MEIGKNNNNMVKFIFDTFRHRSSLFDDDYGKNKIEKRTKNKENFSSSEKISI